VSTRPCPRCAHALADQARFCGQCGLTLAPETTAADEAAAPRARTMLGATMLDPSPLGAQPDAQAQARAQALADLGKTMADPDAELRAREIRDAVLAATETQKPLPEPAKPSFGKTVLIGSVAAPEPAPPTRPAPIAPIAPIAPTAPDQSPLSRSVLAPGSWAPPPPPPSVEVAPVVPVAPQPIAERPAARTVLGMPATELPRPAGATPQPAQAIPQQQAMAPAHKTMLGVAIPGIAPTGASVQPVASSPAAHGPMQLPSRQGTMMGVAVPGIAPTHAADARQAAHPQQQAPAREPPPRIVPAPPPLVVEPIPQTPRIGGPRGGVPAVAVVGILIALVLVLGGVGAYVALRGAGPLTARPQLDETGKESLQIGCPSCPDGTLVSLGASSVTVKAANALLPLPAPLSIGENDLVVHLDRPGAGRDEDVKIHVPVSYRVRADMTTLTARPPAITVRVEAQAGSIVEVDGKPLALDAAGRASYTLELSKETEGPSDDQQTFDKKIPFSITPKDGAPEKGELGARAAIVPLHLDAPGLMLVTEKSTAPVSGQTRPNATLTVDGQAAPVDDKGRFGVRIELAAVGEKVVEIVASAPPLAPRIVRAKVFRAASLEAFAKDLASEMPLAFDVFGADPASKAGQKAVVEGEVVEARVASGHSMLLVEERKACAKATTCLVRVDHGEELKVARGDSVRVYGTLVGGVASGGKSVPDVDASLVIVLPAQPGMRGTR
jgi:hypothetical protein